MHAISELRQRLSELEHVSAQQSDMITLAIKDLYRYCRDNSERQMTQTEYIVHEAFQEFQKRYDCLLNKTVGSSTSNDQISSTQGSNHNVTRLLSTYNSSMSVDQAEEEWPNKSKKLAQGGLKNKLMINTNYRGATEGADLSAQANPPEPSSATLTNNPPRKFDEIRHNMNKLQQILEGYTQELVDDAKDTIEKNFNIKIKKLQRQLQKDIRDATSQVRDK